MCWEAQYTSAKGRPFVILGTATNECPVSLVTDLSTDLVQYFERTRMMHESLGVSPYGGDLNKWPARDVDAFLILQQQHNKVKNLSAVSDKATDRAPQNSTTKI